MAVPVEVRPRLILGVAVALARHPDAEQDVQQPDRQPGADDARRALKAVGVRVQGEGDHAPDDDQNRQPDADEPHAAARTVGSVGTRAGSKAATASSSSPGSPTERSRPARTSAGDSPGARRSSSVTAPWRLASRAPSAPRTSGTCAYEGSGSPSRRA